LLRYDDLLAEIVRRLRPLGEEWIDEFAASYLAINDKNYLPVIVQKIIARAKAQHENSERIKVVRRRRLRIGLASGAITLCAGFAAYAIMTVRATTAGFEGIYEQYKANSMGYYSRADWQSYLNAEETRKKVEQAAAAAAGQARLREQVAQQAAAEERRRQEEAAQKAAQAAEAGRCAGDLHCLGEKYFPEATVYCKPLVERLAKNNFEWIDGWLEPKFSHYRWKNKSLGVITYIGDKIKYQNGFGAWVLSVYECDFDTKSKAVLDVRASPGRL